MSDPVQKEIKTYSSPLQERMAARPGYEDGWDKLYKDLPPELLKAKETRAMVVGYGNTKKIMKEELGYTNKKFDEDFLNTQQQFGFNAGLQVMPMIDFVGNMTAYNGAANPLMMALAGADKKLDKMTSALDPLMRMDKIDLAAALRKMDTKDEFPRILEEVGDASHISPEKAAEIISALRERRGGKVTAREAATAFFVEQEERMINDIANPRKIRANDPDPERISPEVLNAIRTYVSPEGAKAEAKGAAKGAIPLKALEDKQPPVVDALNNAAKEYQEAQTNQMPVNRDSKTGLPILPPPSKSLPSQGPRRR